MKHISGPAMCNALERKGWKLVRINGSHHIYNRPGARRPIPVPVHGNHDLRQGTQRRIMREAGLTEADI